MITSIGDPTIRASLLAVARHGLPGTRDHRPVGAPAGDRAWRSLLIAVRQERLTGLLDRAMSAGDVVGTVKQKEEAEIDAAQGARAVVRLERTLLEVTEHLRGDGLEFAVLKGSAVAHLDETDPIMRHFADIDLLVRSDDVDAALVSLGRFGYDRDLPERRPGFDRRFAKEVSLAKQGRELDLHRTLALGYFGLMLDLDALWASTNTFCLGDTKLVALDAEGRFVHACFNAMLGDEQPRLVALRDIARIASAHILDVDRIARITSPGRGAAVIQTAVTRCRSTLGVELAEQVEEFASSVTPTRRERAALRAYRPQGGSNTLELLSGTLALSGGDRWTYLRALLAPDATHRAARRRAGRPREWRTGLREVLHSAGRPKPSNMHVDDD